MLSHRLFESDLQRKSQLVCWSMTNDTSEMAINTDILKALVEDELARMADARVTSQIRSLLIEPKPVLRDWDYGERGQQYVSWIVLEDHASKTGIAYCQNGFGPRAPWGLIFLEDSSMGMDSGWFTTFLQAYFESVAAILPIWRVFKTEPSGVRLPISPEGGWDETWKQVLEKRQEDQTSRYDCETSIVYERE
jgi:hypothetical protein